MAWRQERLLWSCHSRGGIAAAGPGGVVFTWKAGFATIGVDALPRAQGHGKDSSPLSLSPVERALGPCSEALAGPVWLIDKAQMISALQPFGEKPRGKDKNDSKGAFLQSHSTDGAMCRLWRKHFSLSIESKLCRSADMLTRRVPSFSVDGEVVVYHLRQASRPTTYYYPILQLGL